MSELEVMGIFLCLLRELITKNVLVEYCRETPFPSDFFKEVDSELDFIILSLSKFWCSSMH